MATLFINIVKIKETVTNLVNLTHRNFNAQLN